MKSVHALLVTVVGVALVCSNLRAEDRPREVLGVIVPLTGELAFVGSGIRRGIELALGEEESGKKFKAIFEDDQSLNRAATLTAYKRLVDIEKADLILDIAVNTVSVIAAQLNRDRKLGIVIWDSNKTILTMGKYVVGYGYSNEAAGEDMAAHARSKLGLKNVGVVSAHDEWSEIVTGAFTDSFERAGGRVAFKERVDLTATDFRTIVTKAKAAELEGLYFPLFGPALVSALRQSRELGFKGVLMTGDGFSQNELTQLGPLAEGIQITQIWVDDASFTERYRAKFSDDADSLNMGYAALGYDLIRCLSRIDDALAKDGKAFSSETVREEMEDFSCPGVSGEHRFGKDRISGRREPILQVRGERMTRVD